jgi:16S rRNA (guanine966-N2)-methyltransferase
MRASGLRIIAGSLKGRRLASPAWPGLRPTSDGLRETLFNILGPRVPGARVLDACAGTGAVGIEAISRGAAHVTFFEWDARALDLIAANLERCGVKDGYAIIRMELGRRVPRPFAAVFDLIFLDPPYEMNPVGALSDLAPLVARDGLLVLEHAHRSDAPERPPGLARVREVMSGSSALAFYIPVRAVEASSDERRD